MAPLLVPRRPGPGGGLENGGDKGEENGKRGLARKYRPLSQGTRSSRGRQFGAPVGSQRPHERPLVLMFAPGILPLCHCSALLCASVQAWGPWE